MRYVLLILVFFNVLQKSYAQSNLVLNPSMEQHYDTFNIGLASFLRNFVTDWSDPNIGSSDYMVPNSRDEATTPPNTVFGFEYAHSGYAFGGFVFYEGPTSNNFEYVQASFVHPLEAMKHYAIECFVSLADEVHPICISDLGFHFSDTLVAQDDSGSLLRMSAQYENPPSNMINTYYGWQRITGSYIAHGGESYLSIGMFKPYALAHVDSCHDYSHGVGGYLFIDDVAVYDTSKIDTIQLCMNDSVQIGASWQKTEGLYIDTIGGLPVKFYISMRPNSTNLTTLYRPFEYGDSVRVSLLPSAGNDSSEFTSNMNYLYLKNDTIIDVPMYNIYGCDSTVRYICGWHIGVGKEPIHNLSWSIYPNPSNDFIEIQLSKNDLSSYDILILDVTGKEIFTHSLHQDKIDVTTLNCGLYFVKLVNGRSGELMGVKKFVKE